MVAFGSLPLEEKEDPDLREEKDDDDDDVSVNRSAYDYVFHAYYRALIAEGFEKRAPSRKAPNKPAYFWIEDLVTRTLIASKNPVKATDYNITVANAFCASVTMSALDDAIEASSKRGDPETVSILLSQVHGFHRGYT